MKQVANSQINIELQMTSVQIKQELAMEINDEHSQMNHCQLGSLIQVTPEMEVKGVPDSTGRQGYLKHGSSQVFLQRNLKKRVINDEVVFSSPKKIRRSERLQNKRELRLPATPVADLALIRHKDLPIKEHSLQTIQKDHERFVNRNMKFSVQLEEFHELQLDTLREITYRLKVRGALEAAEVRELQFLVDDARTSIGYVIEKSVTVVEAADKLLRKVLRIESIPEQLELS